MSETADTSNSNGGADDPRELLLDCLLSHVSIDGWSKAAIEMAAEELKQFRYLHQAVLGYLEWQKDQRKAMSQAGLGEEKHAACWGVGTS